MENPMKHASTSKPFFSQADVDAALAAAQTNPPAFDPENPPTADADWDHAIVSHSLPQLRTELAVRRRGPGRAPRRAPTTIRLDPDVLAAFRAGGAGWQTRMNDALRDWLKTHSPEQTPVL
jgi:uncharacterized protein (DUF4415 family)